MIQMRMTQTISPIGTGGMSDSALDRTPNGISAKWKTLFRILVVVFAILIITEFVRWGVYGYGRGDWKNIMSPFVMISIMMLSIQSRRSTLWALLACAGAIGIIVGRVLEFM